MFKNPYIRNTLSALAVAIFGFILLNLTFLFDFLIQSLIKQLFRVKSNIIGQGFPLINHIIFVVIIVLISWFVFKSKLGEIYKVIYSTVPLAVVFVTTGIFLYRWPILLYSVSTLIFGAIMFYLYRTKKTWLYYYTVILVASVLLIMGLLGIDI